MSDAMGIQAAIARVAAQQPHNVSIAAPGLARVPLPPREANEQPVRPKKAPIPLVQPRDMAGGRSPLATGPVASTFAGVDALGNSPSTVQGDANGPVQERGARQGKVAANTLPQAADLVGFARSPRGETVYLESARWEGHIKPAHVTDPPTARGKRTTTWWPVLHSATGAQTMNEQQVIGVIMDAVSKGHWQNAPRGTLLAVYDLPEQQARQFGVSEVKVSAAPDGRILSAYPSAGSNVLAVRELTDEEQSAQQAAAQAAIAPQQHGQQADPNEPLFKTNVANTTFG